MNKEDSHAGGGAAGQKESPSSTEPGDAVVKRGKRMDVPVSENLDSPDWQTLIGEILNALDRRAAHAAATNLADVALPGGSILHSESPRIFDAIEQFGDISASPHAVLLISSLNCMSRWMRRWRLMARAGNADSVVRDGAAVEQSFECRLKDLCDRLTALLHDTDPEKRSAYYLLCGNVASPPEDCILQLNASAEVEESPLARACAVDGMILAFARLDGSRHPALIQLIRQHLQDEAALGRVLSTVRRISDSYERHSIETSLGISEASLDPESVARWQSEEL